MGKKQKMKRAAIAAAAIAAAAKSAQPATSGGGASISSENGCGDVDGGGGDRKSNAVNDLTLKKNRDVGSICNNMQSFLSLARNLNAHKDGKCKSESSSESESLSSYGADSDDEDDTALFEESGAVGGAAESKPKLTEFGVVPKCSRGEKKARRLLMKLDLQPVKNVSRVTMRKAKNVMLFIDHPEVFRCPNTMTLICFGEVRVENGSNTAATQAAERYINDVNTLQSYEVDDEKEPGMAGNGDGGSDSDDLGSKLDEQDIELVQMQATCSRQAAVKALIMHNNDVVNAIMYLTVGAEV